MSGFNYANLVTDIRNYTEVDSNVLTAAIINRIIEDAEFKILREVPIDAYKKQSIGNFDSDSSSDFAPCQDPCSSREVTPRHASHLTFRDRVLPPKFYSGKTHVLTFGMAPTAEYSFDLLLNII